jgi:hypothetical protein
MLMLTLADLNESDWTPVARRVSNPSGLLVWDWFLTSQDQGALAQARAAGRLFTVHKHRDGGVYLLAKLARVGPRRCNPVAFEVVGAGMFEQ